MPDVVGEVPGEVPTRPGDLQEDRPAGKNSEQPSGVELCLQGQARVPVVEWADGQPLSRAIEEVRAFRRYARRVYA